MPRRDLEGIRAAWPVERVLRHYGIEGSESRRIPCKLCGQNDRSGHPSFHYRTDFFYCFRCEAKGDCFSLAMKLGGKSFAETVTDMGGGSPGVTPLVKVRRRPDWQDYREEQALWRLHDIFIGQQLHINERDILAKAKHGTIPKDDVPFLLDTAQEQALRDWESLDEVRTAHLFGMKREVEEMYKSLRSGRPGEAAAVRAVTGAVAEE